MPRKPSLLIENICPVCGVDKGKLNRNKGKCRKCLIRTKEILRHAIQERICRLWCIGLNFNEIARATGRNRKTVEDHWYAFRIRIGIRHPARVVKWAIKHGLTTLE